MKTPEQTARIIDILKGLYPAALCSLQYAKDYGIPQNRERIFLVSIHGDAWFNFPQPVELKLKLKDVLEEEVDEKYYLDDLKVAGFIDSLEREKVKKICGE